MEEIKQVMQILAKITFLCKDTLRGYKGAIRLISACQEYPLPTSSLFIGR